MVKIPGGTLKMGSNDTLPAVGRFVQALPEFPEHDVPVRSFYLDRTEVTNRAFLEFLSKTGRLGMGRRPFGLKPTAVPHPPSSTHPVTRVQYAEAVEFAAWRGCCLPDEAQLEWAARGPESLSEPKNVPPDAPSERWIEVHAVDSDPLDRTDHWSQPIQGLYGNAGELTLFRMRPYPNLVRPLAGDTVRSGFVVRSGAFMESRKLQHLSLGYIKRASLLPESRNPDVGFRCVRPIAFRINALSQPFFKD